MYAIDDQVREWQDAMYQYTGLKSLDTFLPVAGSFYAWWLKRERELFDAARERLEAQAREKSAELLAEVPCEED